MEDEDNKQNTDLAVLNNELKHINESIISNTASNIQDHRDIFATMARKSDLLPLLEKEKEARTDIDAHCLRIRELEKKQAVETYKLAAIVSGIVFVIYFAINALWDYLSKRG